MRLHLRSLVLLLTALVSIPILVGRSSLSAMRPLQQEQPAAEQPSAEQPEEGAELAKRLERLERRVTDLEGALRAQAAAAAQLESAMNVVEKQGFTAGINYKSRESLLAALRSLAKSVQSSARALLPNASEGEGETGDRKRTRNARGPAQR